MRESTPMERERTREPVSAVERERTMRNLVDMQRKVEQRQQRDRERQLLRVRERWWSRVEISGTTLPKRESRIEWHRKSIQVNECDASL